MRLSSLADYAVVIMAAAARHCGGGMIDHRRINARVLADETGVPQPTVQKLVSKLAAAHLIESTRGSGGGIRLSRPPSMITIAEIVEAIDGPIAITSCSIIDHHHCALEQGCCVRPHWGPVNAAVRAALADVSLASLVRTVPPAAHGVPTSQLASAEGVPA
jgi:FeS assembly SUF system regulator